MKRNLTLIALLVFNFQLSTVNCNAQSPRAINYQAVARDAAGVIMANQTICVRFFITDGSAGPTYYIDTATVVTNQFGLFTFGIGSGDTTGYSGIPWATIDAWLRVNIDVNCTGTLVDMGSSQLLSVPYATLASKSADNRWTDSGYDIYNTNAGNVGIGTAFPTSALTVNGVITATGGSSDDWNTAYSWGNHALAGYITSESDPKVGTLTDNYVPRWQSTSLVDGAIYDNGYYVGIGTTNPGLTLDVNGGMRIGDYFGGSGGSMRYHNGDLEGYTTNGWTSLTQTKYQSFTGTNLSSTVRNAYVYTTDSILIAETGYYLLTMNVNGHNDNYATGGNPPYDNASYVTAYQVGFGALTDAVPLFIKYLDNDVSSYQSRFLPENSSRSQIVQLYVGDVLKIRVFIDANGSPPFSWYMDYYSLQVLKLK